MAREVDKNCVEGNCFAINDKSHGVGDNKLNIVYKANYTGQICTAKFRITSKDGSVVKEYMIAQDAKPVYYNIKMVQPFTKDDCLANQHGSVVLYVVEERTYKSFISQEDADAKAMEDIALNGQKYANEHGECITDIWYNEEQRKTFIRNNCDKFSDGQEYVYIVPEGKYVSSISQEDADRKALEDIEKNGQQQANLEGECKPKENIYYGKFSKTFTRNNCDSTQYGTEVVVNETMVEGDFRSIVSQKEANKLAQAAVEAQGQDIANIKGNCEKIPVFTGSYSKVFQRTNCPEGSTPVDFTVDEKMCTGYPFTSIVSQDAANKLAQDAVEAQGQAITNERGDCQTNVYYNVRMEKTVTRNNCDEFHIGQPYTYVVAAGKYFSIISQKDADNKAKADLEANAQQQANLEGECKEKVVYHGKYSKEFTRNNCDETQYGTKVVVDETMVTGDFRSTVSQEDANNKAKAAVEAQGQDIANIKGNCEKIPVFTGSYSKVFQRTNCPEGSTPVDFTVDEKMCTGYPFTSIVSQDAANKLAQDAVEAQGQAITNERGDCQTNVYYNVRMEKTVTRNNCDEFHIGQPYTYVVAAGKYFSIISQKDADNKAKADLEANAQQQANLEGECKEKVVYHGKYSKEFTRNNCDETQYGTKVVVDETMVTGDFRSTVSQEDANNKAKAAVEAQGQDVANVKGKCEKVPVYTGTYTRTFTRNNCGTGTGGTYTVNDRMVDGYPFTSTVSQEDANSKAKAAVDAQGQALANIHALCTYTGRASLEFTRNNCGECKIGSKVTITQDMVEGHPFQSNDSQTAADAMAMTAVQAQGQALANTKGTCSNATMYTGKASFEFTKSNCGANQVGDPFTVTQDMVDGHPFQSCVSQDEANLVAMAAVMNQGQKIADERGTCHEAPKYTGHYSEAFEKNNCPSGLIPSSVTVTEADVTGGPFYSYESQHAADELAKAAVKAQGQAIANDRGTCDELKIYVGNYSKEFTPKCPTCQYADPITVTPDLMGQFFTSTRSQEEADALAKAYIDRMGQAFVNKNYDDTCHTKTEQPVWETIETVCKDCISKLHQRNTNTCYTDPENQERYIAGGNKTCFWFGTASKAFTRQCADGGVGSSVTVTQNDVTDPAPSSDGKFKSCVSQADANAKALAAVTAQGQSVANSKGTCTWTGSYTGQVRKNNCADGGVGDMVSVSSSKLPGHPYTSTVSLADANKKAENAVRGSDGQAYANKNGGCTWTYVASRDFYRNNCAGSGVGQRITVTSTQANGGTAITSKVSLADARSKAEQILDQKGQDYANQHGTCVWTGTGSATFYKDNCGSCKQGVAISVPYSSLGLDPITSTVSQADANNKVQEAFRSNSATRAAAQAYANKNGDCEGTPPNWSGWSYDGGNYCSGGDVWARYRRTDSTGCHSDETENRLHESCDCGCSGGSCDSCCDPNSWSRIGEAECRSGESVALYRNDCGREEYLSYGSACCNMIGFQGGSATSRNCPSDRPCGVTISYPDVPSGSICASSTSSANAQASDKIEMLRSQAQALADAGCSGRVCNDYVEATATKQGCPSGCTAPKASAYWVSGGNNGAWCECNGDKAALTAAAQADAQRLAQEKANAMECDCPQPTKKWSASAYVDGNPCNGTPSGTSALRVKVEISYSNECTTQKSLTVTASSSGTTIGSKTVTIPTGSGTKKTTISFDRGYPCNSINISGRGGGQC